MSKIKIFSLGGLNEVGKNIYCVDVDNALFVFDCGLKYASENLYGIDYIIPDFTYLVKNKKRLKGVFLSHAHYENIGAVADLIKEIPTVKIYATKYTKFILLQDGVNQKSIIEIKPHKKIKFNDVSIFPINVSHSVPDSVMYVLNTKDGSIVYTGDFIVDPSMGGAYATDLGKIAYVGKQGVLALLSESVFSEHNGFTAPTHRLTSFFKDVINKNEYRTIFLLLPTHLYTIQDIFNSASNGRRKVIIMGKKLQSIINMASKEGYLHFDEKILGDLSNLDDKDSIILVGDDKAQQYSSISRIMNNYDKFVKLKENDTVVFAEPRYDSSEKTLVKIQNDLAVLGVNIVSIPKEKNILHHASSEDLKLMLDLLKPKYYMPVKGEYRYMVGNAHIAEELSMPKENIILHLNGEVATFENKELLAKVDKVGVNDILIDGKSSDDVGDLVIKDRQMLGENGIVLISATLSKKTKEILVGPEVTTRGFIYVKDSKEMISQIKALSFDIIMRNVSPSFIDYNKIKVEIREELSRYLYGETECKPMIIAVVQEV